jgi:four helix bundle protein
VCQILFSFEKLEVYQEARAFRIRVYKLAALLPQDEFKLKIQMRDAARSLTNCIAEGHGRFTFKDRRRFLIDARGSLQEIVDDINLCLDEHYAKPEHLEDLKHNALRVLKKINGYMKYLRNQQSQQSQKKTVTPIQTPLNHLTT